MNNLTSTTRHRVPERMDVQFTVPLTRRMRTRLEVVADHQRTTVAHVIREAIRAHLTSLGIPDEAPPPLDTLVRAVRRAEEAQIQTQVTQEE